MSVSVCFHFYCGMYSHRNLTTGNGLNLVSLVDLERLSSTSEIHSYQTVMRYNENCQNHTLNKAKSSINQALSKDQM